MCSFHQVDSVVKITLLKSYCLSLYGCELWNLQHPAIGNICKSWRHGMRRVGCTYFTSELSVCYLYTNILDVYRFCTDFDIICKRAVMFARNCLNSSSDVVMLLIIMSVLAGWLLEFDGMYFGCENFSLPLNDLLSEKFNTQYVISHHHFNT